MNEVKWIKIQTDIFTKVGGSLDAIKALPDARDIELIWIQILCLAGSCNENGLLTIGKEFPYTDEMLANAFNFDVGTIQRALAVFMKLNMIEVVDDVYLVSNWEKYQSTDKLEKLREKNRERQRRFYEAHKNIPSLPEKESSENKKSIEKPNVRSNVRPNVKITLNCSNSISYSFNTHNNVDNYIYIKNKGEYKNLIYINNNKVLDNIITEWLSYKDEMSKNKGHYDTERGLCSLLTEFVNNDKSLGTGMVVAVIHHCMTRNWTGIYWDTANQLKPEKVLPEQKTQNQTKTEESEESVEEWMARMKSEE